MSDVNTWDVEATARLARLNLRRHIRNCKHNPEYEAPLPVCSTRSLYDPNLRRQMRTCKTFTILNVRSFVDSVSKLPTNTYIIAVSYGQIILFCTTVPVYLSMNMFVSRHRDDAMRSAFLQPFCQKLVFPSLDLLSNSTISSLFSRQPNACAFWEACFAFLAPGRGITPMRKRQEADQPQCSTQKVL